jgi:hypothetical protein
MALGMEIEVARPLLAPDGRNLVGDTELLVMPGLLKLVSDKRSLRSGGSVQYSNAEIVTVHFDQHAGTADQAAAQLEQRLGAVRLLIEDLYQDESNRPLSRAVRARTHTAYEAFARERFDPAVLKTAANATLLQEAVVAPQTYRVPNNETRMLIHYTVGIAPEKLGEALAVFGGMARGTASGPNSGKVHAQQAQAVGRECLTLVPAGSLAAEHVAEFEGFLALVYTQAGAFADIVAGSEATASDPTVAEVAAQPKNYVVALSRVPLRTIFDALHPDVRDALYARADAIEELIGDRIVPEFHDGDARSLDGLREVTFKEYLRSALGHLPAVDQERVFGGMNETGLDPTVHGTFDPDPARGRGIPVELRLHGTRYPSWDQFAREARDLLRWSREHAGLSDRPAGLSADYWLTVVNHLLADYQLNIDKLTGTVPLAPAESELGVNWAVTSLNSWIAGLLRAYPGFPTRERTPAWTPVDLGDFTCAARFVQLSLRIGKRIKGFTPDPFPGPAPEFDFTRTEMDLGDWNPVK